MGGNMERYDYLIVGGGPASRLVNRMLKLYSPKEVSTLLIRDEAAIVNHCAAPYMVDETVAWDRGLIPDELVTKFKTPIRIDGVTGGNTSDKYVELESGDKVGYGKLIIATGSDQIVPPVDGRDLMGVLRVKRTADLQDTISAVGGVRNVVVVGAGYIGVEFALSLRKKGLAVTLVELKDHVFGGIYDPELMEQVETTIAKQGIDLKLGRKVKSVRGEEKVEAVVLDGGEEIHTDAVLFSVGVYPLVEFAKEMGIETVRDGIKVDEYFRTNVQDVYALGDCVSVNSMITDLNIPGKLGSNAGVMAKHLSLHLLGKDIPFRGVLNPVATRLPGLSFGAVGATTVELEMSKRNWDSVTVDSATQYSNMPHARPVRFRLLYDTDTLEILGGEMIGDLNPSGYMEALAAHIERKSTVRDLMLAHFVSHPELTPKPSHPYLPLAGEAAARKHWKKVLKL